MTGSFWANRKKSEEARCMACLTGPKSEEARASVPQWLRRLCRHHSITPSIFGRHPITSHLSVIGWLGNLVAALLRVAGVTAGLAESNGQPTAGFMTHDVTCRLTAKYQDQLRNPTLGNRVWATFTFFYLLSVWRCQVNSFSPSSNDRPTCN